MTEQLQMTRRTILGGAAFAGVLTPIIAASMARAEGGAIETNAAATAADIARIRIALKLDDPFPIRYIGGKTRDGIVLHDELVAWVERNSVVGSPRRG